MANREHLAIYCSFPSDNHKNIKKLKTTKTSQLYNVSDPKPQELLTKSPYYSYDFIVIAYALSNSKGANVNARNSIK